MGNNVYGIDLGTCNIKIYSKNDDGIMIEKIKALSEQVVLKYQKILSC